MKTKLFSPFRLPCLIIGLALALYGCDLFSSEEEDPEPKEELVPVTLTFHVQTVSVPIGGEMQIHYMISPDTATVTDFVWTSSNTTVATVSQTGLVKALGLGSTEIKLSTAKRNAQVTAMVTVTPIDLNAVSMESDVIPAYINEAKSLALTFEPDSATDKTVTWTSSDNSVVSIDESGTITANKLGYAWVTAQHSGSVFDNAVIVPAVKGQAMAASQINESGTKHYINVYAAALGHITKINEVKLYLGFRGDVNSSELKTVNPDFTLAAGEGKEIKIEVNAEEANQLTFGRYLRIDATINGEDYYVYVSWMNNIEFEKR